METSGAVVRPGAEGSAPVLAQCSTRWRIIETPAADGATNMAVDAALLDDAGQGGVATLRLYRWAEPTLSLGRHERGMRRFDPDRLSAHGIGVVRRMTGGRALLHDRELTYAVAAPTGGATSRDRQRALSTVLILALERLGVRVAVAKGPARTLRPGRGACFSEPSRGELTLDGAKLVASAQLDGERAFLQHGSILLANDQARIAQFATESDFPPTRAASLAHALGRTVPYSEVARAMASALVDALAGGGVTLSPVAESFEMGAAQVQKHRTQFLDPAWTWLR
jgi:lipoate-protein ligase A